MNDMTATITFRLPKAMFTLVDAQKLGAHLRSPVIDSDFWILEKVYDQQSQVWPGDESRDIENEAWGHWSETIRGDLETKNLFTSDQLELIDEGILTSTP